MRKVTLFLCLFASLFASGQNFIQSKNTKFYLSHNPYNAYGAIRKARMFDPNAPRPTNNVNPVPQDDWTFNVGTHGGMLQSQFPAVNIASLGSVSCSGDFAVYPLNATPGVGSQANLFGVNNLYTGTTTSFCPSGSNGGANNTGPSVYFAYAVGSAAIKTSPALSLTGGKLAVVESGSPAKLHIITLSQQTGSPTNVTTNAIAPPTETVISFTLGGANCTSSSTTDTNSDPFADYSNDRLFVGDDNGRVYVISGAFNGTPAIAYCGAVAASGAKLSLPVYDSTTNKIVVHDFTNGKLYSATVGATAFSSITSVTLGAANSIADAPLVDDYGFVYSWVNNDNGSPTSVAIYQYHTSTLTQNSKLTLGGSVSNAIYAGDFDNNYWVSGPTGANATLYSLGYNAATAGVPTLNSIQFNASSVMSFLMQGDTNIDSTSTTTGTASGITEAFDAGRNKPNGSDELFVSANGGAGRLSRWVVNTAISNNTTAASTTAPVAGGGSGIIPDGDTITTDNQTGNIYFGSLAAGGRCAASNWCVFKVGRAALAF